MENTDSSGLLAAYGRDLYDLEKIAREIIAYTGQSEAEVWRRLALELQQNGTNVVAETARFGVTPHIFDDNLIKFYTESDGFIYETCIESRNPHRMSKWFGIVNFLRQQYELPGEHDILVYGDSVGSDSIFLSRMGFNVFYHDFDSYCSRFAKARFQKRNLPIHSFRPGDSRQFDCVICFEVAEHVPNPPELIEELAQLTAPDGYCIFSESFGLLDPNYPTHLASNAKYIKMADSMFQQNGMHVAWRDVHEKPIVYTRLRDVSETRPSPVLLTLKDVARSLRHFAGACYRALSRRS